MTGQEHSTTKLLNDSDTPEPPTPAAEAGTSVRRAEPDGSKGAGGIRSRPGRLNRPAGLNRAVLGLLGIVLLAGGGFAVATHFGWVTVLHRSSRLVAGTGRPPTWVLYITVAVAVIVGLGCLRWLFAQLVRGPKARTWRLEDDPRTGRTELTTATAIAPFVDELKTYPGVSSATGTLSGPRTSPTVDLVITAAQDGDLAEIRHRLDVHGLPRLRQSLELGSTPQVTVEFRFSTTT